MDDKNVSLNLTVFPPTTEVDRGLAEGGILKKLIHKTKRNKDITGTQLFVTTNFRSILMRRNVFVTISC